MFWLPSSRIPRLIPRGPTPCRFQLPAPSPSYRIKSSVVLAELLVLSGPPSTAPSSVFILILPEFPCALYFGWPPWRLAKCPGEPPLHLLRPTLRYYRRLSRSTRDSAFPHSFSPPSFRSFCCSRSTGNTLHSRFAHLRLPIRY